MQRHARTASAMAGALAMLVAACVDPQEVSEIKGKVDELQAQQKDVLTKLDSLSKGQKAILAKAPAPAAAAPSRPKVDPNKVYDVPVGKSYAKGPENAAVTIVEFSDYQ